MVVKCPNCGQQVRGQPGQSGPCPKCGTRFKFPEGDSRAGEPMTCPHCGQKQQYRDGRCISCGKSLVDDGQKSDIQKNTPHRQKHGLFKSIGLIVAVLAVAFIVGAAFFSLGGDSLGAKQDEVVKALSDANSKMDAPNWKSLESNNRTSSNTSSASSYSYSGGISDDYKLALFMLAQDEVKKQLKSPSSAEFASSYTSSDVVYSRDGNTYGILSWVEAQNDFGVTIREEFVVFADISTSGQISNVVCIIDPPM